MKNWSYRTIALLLLGVFLTLGTSVSVVQANEMAVKMTYAASMSTMQHGDCHSCGGQVDGKAQSCAAICGSAIIEALPEMLPVMVVVSTGRQSLPQAAAIVGIDAAPIPFPPRSTASV